MMPFLKRSVFLSLLILLPCIPRVAITQSFAATGSPTANCHECHQPKEGLVYGVLEWISPQTGFIQIRTPNGIEIYRPARKMKVRNVKNSEILGKTGEPVRVRLTRSNAPVPHVSELTLKPGIKVPSDARIKGRTLLSMIQKGPRHARYTLIDARKGDDFEARHIPTAIRLDGNPLETSLRKGEGNEELLIFYGEGARWPSAWNATRTAREKGFKNARIYRGGLSDWWKKGKQPISLSKEYLKKMMDAGAYPVILDMRSPGAMKKGFIPGAVHVNPENLEERKRMFPPETGATIVLYGPPRITNTIVKTMRVIRSWGYSDIRILEGGFQGWQTAGYPIQTGRPNIMISYVPPLTGGQISTVDFMDAADGPLQKEYLLLDVRDPGETRQGALNNAICIPVTELADRLKDLPRNQEIIAFSSNEKRSEIAYHVLNRNGFRAAYLPRPVSVDSFGYYLID